MRRNRKWLIAVVVVSLAVWISAFIWPYRFHFLCICSKCRRIERTTRWEWPNSDWSLYTHHTTEETPLSIYLTNSGWVGAHEHDWVGVHGGGNRKTASGNGLTIERAVNAQCVVDLLIAARQFGEPGEDDQFLRYVFDPDISRSVAPIAESMPTGGFSSSKEYREWLSQHDWLINTYVRRASKNPAH